MYEYFIIAHRMKNRCETSTLLGLTKQFYDTENPNYVEQYTLTMTIDFAYISLMVSLVHIFIFIR